MSISIVEKRQEFKKKSTIAIRPYVDKKSTNLGLAKYGQVVFEGTYHIEPLMCLEQNGIRRYVTGLNEFDQSLNLLPEDEKASKIKQIREKVAHLELVLAANKLDVDDKDFWKKVQVVSPTNYDYWDRIEVKLSNDPVYLDPINDPLDLIRIAAIEADGFSSIAKNLSEAIALGGQKKFYLDREEVTISTKIEVAKLRNKAAVELEKMASKDQKKLFFVCKNIDAYSAQYKKDTSLDKMYDDMDRYINGQSLERDLKKAATNFLEVCKMDIETLKLKAVIRDCNYFKEIAKKSDGFLYHIKTGVAMGRTLQDVFDFLKNPLNDDTLRHVLSFAENKWNN